MQLMDDALYKHWSDGVCLLDDVMERAHRPDDLAKRIAEAEMEMRASSGRGGKSDDDDMDAAAMMEGMSAMADNTDSKGGE